MKTWTKLDNAAKIFPVVSNKTRTNLFSISFTLNETIDRNLLQQALESTIKRFKSFRMRLRIGLFWYYLEEIKQMPQVVAENSHILEPIDKYQSNGYLFRVCYFNNKITLEVFHSLTDGYGATQFLKALVFTYLQLKYKQFEFDSEGKVLIDDENEYAKSQDSFLKIYDEKIKPDRTETKGVHFVGTPYEDNWLGVITGIVKKEEFKTLITKYDCTYTQFIVGLINYCANQLPNMLDNTKKPFQTFIPVDLRRIYTSKSLRNFSMIVKTSIMLNNKLSLEEYIKICKEQLIEKVSNDYLLPRVIGNIKYEKMFIMRIVPLFIKVIALKIGYSKMSTIANSFCISNLGRIDLPKVMENYVTKIIFSNGAMKKAPLNMGVVYYKDNVYITITSSIEERDFQRLFFRELANLGLNITIESNDLEAK